MFWRTDLRNDDTKRKKNKHVLKLPLEVTHTMSIETPSIVHRCSDLSCNSLGKYDFGFWCTELLGYPWKLWGITVQTSYVEGLWHQNWVRSRLTKNVDKYSLRSILLRYQFFLTYIFVQFQFIFTNILRGPSIRCQSQFYLNFFSSIPILLYKSAARSFNFISISIVPHKYSFQFQFFFTNLPPGPSISILSPLTKSRACVSPSWTFAGRTTVTCNIFAK